MVGLFRVLKDIARTPSPFDGASVSFSLGSTTVDELTYSLPTEAVHWERQDLKAELYQSLFSALAEHGDLPPDEPSSPAEVVRFPNGYFIAHGQLYSPSVYSDHDIAEEHIIEEHVAEERTVEQPVVEEQRYAKNVTFKDYAHLVENLCGLPMDQASSSVSLKDASIEAVSIKEVSIEDTVSIEDCASTAQSSTAIPRRGIFRFIREKSARAIKAVKTAIRRHRDKPYDDWPIGDSDGTTKASDQPRRASDATASSEDTKDSAATVYHWSSKHVKHPIQTTSSSESLSNPRTSHSSTFVYQPSNYDPPAVSCLPEYSLPHRLFSDLGLHGRQMTAFISYNDLARKFGFYTLCLPEYDPINFQMFIRLRPSKRELILRKVRSLGSHIRPRSPNRRVQNLRRMRTFANLSLKYYKMDSLKGKDLATMGRLCGYGSLKLPGDCAPAVMRLPAPIVSLISYLVTHGPKARNVFADPGDLVVASLIYDHFANQILAPDNEIIGQMAVRRSLDFSDEVFGVQSDSETFLRGRFHVLSVAWAFKYILACIPGGFLGAPRLYSTLVDILHQKFPDEPAVPERGLNGALPEVSPTKARAISLAILALTNDLQLDFLCAIFGLCSFLDHETRTMLDFYRSKNIPLINRACLLDRKRILLTFAPLLCEETKDLNDDDYGCEAFWVMAMMLDYWRVVSRQLCDAEMGCFERMNDSVLTL